MVKFRYEDDADEYTITLGANDAKLLTQWMQLSAVCLQTWPVSAHEILLQAKGHKLI